MHKISDSIKVQKIKVDHKMLPSISLVLSKTGSGPALTQCVGYHRDQDNGTGYDLLIGSLTPSVANPVCSVAMMSTPRNAELTLPRPPIRLVPPITHADSSIPTAAFGSAVDNFAAWKIPAIPQNTPQRTNAVTLYGTTLMPDRRTASSFVPIAMQYRHTVRRRTNWLATTTVCE